ncbi:MAG: Rrf2 family transcriptional regulator [Planctomycetota bacterium]
MFSKRARYALHGVGFLAHRHGEPPLPFSEILRYLQGYSSELSLSPGYISKIFQDLSRAGIVRSALGRKGGYTLGRDPDLLRVADVVVAVDKHPLEPCCLLSIDGCRREGACGVNQLIREAQESLFRFLAGETVAALARRMFGERPAPAEPAEPRKS